MVGSSLGIDVLARVLDAANLRHQVIAQNVANVNTPNYHRLTVTFEDDLARVLKVGGDPGTVRPHTVEAADGADRADGNTVDVDQEMGQMSDNSLLYSAAAQVMASRLATLRSAITGR
jgi:flagellar basal-body rod protein FlgB